MSKEIGFERNTSPPDDAPDARELVPEMMERLWAGEAIELADTVGRPYTRCRLVDYVGQVADRPEVVEVMTGLSKMTTNRGAGAYGILARGVIKEAIRNACEADADYYAAAKREISDGDRG